MAHNLNYNEELGREAFFTVKEKAWHNLGIVLESAPTASEAIKQAGLDYKIDITQNHIKVGDLWIPSDSRSTYRTDTNQVLGGKLGDRYEIVQNAEAFDFFDQVVGKDLAIYETAGALGNGETIFITAKLPNYITVMGDVTEQYLVFTMSHDGTGAIKAFFTPVRVVCNNTLNAALKNMKNSISVRHTKNAQAKLVEASNIWKMVNTMSPAIEHTFNQLAKVRITDKKVLDLLELVFPGKLDENGEVSTRTSNIRDLVNNYIQTHETQQTEATKGTLYGFYNGVTGYLQNIKAYKSEDIKFENLFKGKDYEANQTALDLCMKELVMA